MSRVDPDIFAVLRAAIRDKRPVGAVYHGYYRVLCPHALGRKNRRWHVLAFQIGGESDSGLTPEGEWRCLDLEDLSEVRLAEAPWRSGPGWAQAQTCIDEMVERVEAE